MDRNADFMKELIATFSTELQENLEVITSGLLWLESNGMQHADSKSHMEKIFRCAHNLKGAARGVGVMDVGEIAHHVESIFSALQGHASMTLSPDIISLCLEAVDGMRFAMQSFLQNTVPDFDLPDLLQRLSAGASPETQGPHRAASTVKAQASSPGLRAGEENVDDHVSVAGVSEIDGHERESIRVTLASIEKISALMEEMQVNKISIDDHYAGLTKFSLRAGQLMDHLKKLLHTMMLPAGRGSATSFAELKTASLDALAEMMNMSEKLQKCLRPVVGELSGLSASLQDEVRTLRLVPAASLLSSFPRLVRDLARELGKDIRFSMSGEMVKMDRLVLEKMKDPLAHLLRNAVDHGIETPEIRLKYGKSATGHIDLRVTEEGSFILFELADDGAGIDAEKIAALAIDRNLVSRDECEAMSEAEKLELVFRSGFSTRETVSVISGRGVGLDVVRENIASLNGQVTITTTLLKQTVFTLRVPLTLSSERGLVVSAGGQLFVIPVSVVERVLSVAANKILHVEASGAILSDRQALPLRVLSAILMPGNSAVSGAGELPVVVLRKGAQTVALAVDEILGDREIVTKPLQPPLVAVNCVAGGTLAGDGQVMIVLNPGQLIDAALRAKNIRMTGPVGEPDAGTLAQALPHILVADDSITTRTLEKNILESHGYRVSVAVNGREAWDMLQKQKFSLLITDVSMPVMDGFTLTEKVKTSHDFGHLPVVIVTSLDSIEEKKRGLDVGANAYIVKGEFESGILLDIVSQLV